MHIWYFHMWKYQILYFHMWRYHFLDYLWLFYWLTAVHFRTSNAYNFLICGQKHQVWVFIFLIRTWGIFWYQNYLSLLKFFVFHLFHLILQYACIACFAQRLQDFMTSFVYNKKKIQIFLLNMSFISLVKWKICIFHSWLRHSWNINIFHFTRWNKFHIQQKNLNILYVLLFVD